MLEVCVDSLESACNAVFGGADELELCSSLTEGGLTPSPGLVNEVVKLGVKVNVMIRCRSGANFCYTEQEMSTMLSDIDIYKGMGVNRFVFGALTENQDIDKLNCEKIVEKAGSVPVTFHRAYDLCKEPKTAIQDVIKLGFDRLLTSGQKSTAADNSAVELLQFLLTSYGHKLQIMPGAGVNFDNAKFFIDMGFEIIHSSCKKIRQLNVNGDSIPMGSSDVYVTDETIVRKIKDIIKSYSFIYLIFTVQKKHSTIGDLNATRHSLPVNPKVNSIEKRTIS